MPLNDKIWLLNFFQRRQVRPRIVPINTVTSRSAIIKIAVNLWIAWTAGVMSLIVRKVWPSIRNRIDVTGQIRCRIATPRPSLAFAVRRWKIAHSWTPRLSYTAVPSTVITITFAWTAVHDYRIVARGMPLTSSSIPAMPQKMSLAGEWYLRTCIVNKMSVLFFIYEFFH